MRKIAEAEVIDQLAWSPDGSELAYSAPAGGTPAIFRLRLSGGSAARVQTPQGATSPSWSKARNLIAFVSNAPATGSGASRAALGIVTPDGHPVPVAWLDDARISNGWVCWSPDGHFIAALSNPGTAASRLWIAGIDDGSPAREVARFGIDQRTRGLAWMPDQSAVIVGTTERTSDIVLFDQGP
jgi:Tol biopolymer transport system component